MKAENQDDDANGLIKVTKNRILGLLRTTKESAVRTFYSVKCKRITDIRAKGEKVYGWEKQFDDYQDYKLSDELPF